MFAVLSFWQILAWATPLTHGTCAMSFNKKYQNMTMSAMSAKVNDYEDDKM